MPPPMNKDETVRPVTGWYADKSGQNWFCVVRATGGVVCNSHNGDFTAADAKTFARWGWAPIREASNVKG